VSADLLTPAPNYRPKGFKSQEYRAPVVHDDWCAVQDRLRQRLCPDLGCESPTRETALGDIRVVTGATETGLDEDDPLQFFGDVAITPNGTHILSAVEALDVAGALVENATLALGGEPHRPAYRHILKTLDFVDVLDLLREALAVARADAKNEPRPRGTKYAGAPQDAGQASLGPILAVLAVLSAVVGAVTMLQHRLPGFAGMVACPVLLVAAVVGANVFLPKLPALRRRRALKTSEVTR
jgi:hypothetical protein